MLVNTCGAIGLSFEPRALNSACISASGTVLNIIATPPYTSSAIGTMSKIDSDLTSSTATDMTSTATTTFTITSKLFLGSRYLGTKKNETKSKSNSVSEVTTAAATC